MTTSTPLNLPARIEERANGLFDVVARIDGTDTHIGVEIHDFNDAASIARDFNRHSAPGTQFAIAAQNNTSAVITFGGVPVAVLSLSDAESFRSGEPRAAFVVQGVEISDGFLSPTLSSSRVASSLARIVPTDATTEDLLSGGRA